MSTNALARFAADRPRLLGLAYRMLGSMSDAEDLVQETWMRWERDDRSDVENPEGWWTTTATRLAIDRTRVIQRRKETYVGPWLPEPVSTRGSRPGACRSECSDPADAAELSDSLTFGFLVLLESLTPLERATFLLVEVFGESYAYASGVVDRSEVACRQIVRRARTAIGAHRHRSDADRATAEQLALQFMATAVTGDIDAMARLLVDEPVLISDGGPDRRAARHPVIGTHRVTRLLANITRRPLVEPSVEAGWINDEPAIIVRAGSDHEIDTVMIFEVADDRISALWLIRNPDELRHVAIDAMLP